MYNNIYILKLRSLHPNNNIYILKRKKHVYIQWLGIII
jgi:hypothetical protein